MPLPRPPSPPDQVDRRDLDDYGIDPDGPDQPPLGEEIDPALSALLKGLPGMNAEDLEEMLKDLPLPQPGATGGISVEEAVELKLLPALDREALGLFTASERILQEFAQEKKVNATFIKDLIQKVLHHPDFDPAEVDHDMHERLMGAIEQGDLQIIDLREEGDGDQDVRLFKRPADKVLRELLADPRLAGCQHFAFREYKDRAGARIIGGHANGSVTFQLAQIRVGEGTVPISIVLYVDGSFIKRGIPIRPVYCKLHVILHSECVK